MLEHNRHLNKHNKPFIQLTITINNVVCNKQLTIKQEKTKCNI